MRIGLSLSTLQTVLGAIPEAVNIHRSTHEHGHEEPMEATTHGAIALKGPQSQPVHVLSQLREYRQLPVDKIWRKQVLARAWIVFLQWVVSFSQKACWAIQGRAQALSHNQQCSQVTQGNMQRVDLVYGSIWCRHAWVSLTLG